MTSDTILAVDVCVFDAYGTLFNVNSAAARMQTALGDRVDALNELWRRKQLEYTWLRSLMGRHADFDTVTADALDHALEVLGIAPDDVREDLLSLYGQLDAYPEVPQMLARLKENGIRTAILSNGTPQTLSALTAHAGLDESLDAILSIEQAGIFKPAPSVYQLAVDHFSVPAERIAFMSSNPWDAAGAAAFGFQVVWVNRTGQLFDRLGVKPKMEVKSLEGLPGLIS